MEITTTGTLLKVCEQENYGQNSVKQRVVLQQSGESWPPVDFADNYFDLYVYNNKISGDLLKALQGCKVEITCSVNSYPVRPNGQSHYKNITVLNLKSVKLC